MPNRHILLNSVDKNRLIVLSENAQLQGRHTPYLKQLNHELNQAKVFEPTELPKNAVTMNAKVTFKDLKTKEKQEVTLVYPAKANSEEHHVSVLAPLGTALLGAVVGDTLEFEVPQGTRRIKVVSVEQPEHPPIGP